MFWQEAVLVRHNCGFHDHLEPFIGVEAHDFGLAVQASERIFHECIGAHGVDVHLASLAQPGAVLECNLNRAFAQCLQ